MDNDLAAVEDYRMAIDCNKFCYPAHIGLYLALVNTHDVNAADQVLVDALELENKKEDDRYYKGILHYYKGEYDKAELLLSEAIDLEHYEAYYYLGRVYMARAKFEEALEYFTSFLEECPSGINAEYCNELGGCYMEMKEYELAREWFAKGVEIAAGNVRQQILYNEIIAYERLGNTLKEEK